jgi:hypothetical protein
MRITVINKQNQISRLAIEQAKSKIQTAFSKFGNHITSIECFVEDINGPKGGVDKKCQIVVNLRRLGAVVVSEEKATFSKAISRAVSRARQAVSKNVQRRLIRKSKRIAKIQFGLQS